MAKKAKKSYCITTNEIVIIKIQAKFKKQKHKMFHFQVVEIDKVEVHESN